MTGAVIRISVETLSIAGSNVPVLALTGFGLFEDIE
jgi:hypothetical protein